MTKDQIDSQSVALEWISNPKGVSTGNITMNKYD